MTQNQPGGHAWIGHWSPGIGDPSVFGWITVFLYIATAWQCSRLATKHSAQLQPGETTLWWVLALGLLALGINKQLDLQTAFTEIGRMVAIHQGWYARHREVQLEFIYGIAAVAGLTAVALAVLARRAHVATIFALLGSVFLLAFVVIRAASFHHVDLFIKSEFLGMRMNWLMEIGGICIISAGALWRCRVANALRA